MTTMDPPPAAPATALETRILEALRDLGPQSSVMLVRALHAPRVPLHFALRQLERGGAIRPVGVTATAPEGRARDQGPIRLWDLASPAAGA